MLSEEEKKEIDAELRQYEYKRAACVDALKVIQRHRGWVSDESLGEVADYLDMTLEELDRTATFYNLIFRKPVGRHVILVCDSVSCWLAGCERLQRQLTGRLGMEVGGTTADGRFTLLPIVCLGACDRAPAMMIGSELYGGLDGEPLDAILARHP